MCARLRVCVVRRMKTRNTLFIECLREPFSRRDGLSVVSATRFSSLLAVSVSPNCLFVCLSIYQPTQRAPTSMRSHAMARCVCQALLLSSCCQALVLSGARARVPAPTMSIIERPDSALFCLNVLPLC